MAIFWCAWVTPRHPIRRSAKPSVQKRSKSVYDRDLATHIQLTAPRKPVRAPHEPGEALLPLRRGHDVHAERCPRNGRYQTVLRSVSAFTSLIFRCSYQASRPSTPRKHSLGSSSPTWTPCVILGCLRPRHSHRASPPTTRRAHSYTVHGRTLTYYESGFRFVRLPPHVGAQMSSYAWLGVVRKKE